MASQDDLPQRTNLLPETIFAAREAFQPDHPMHRILTAELNRAAKELQSRLESCEPENLKLIQGEIKGLRKAIGILNVQKN